MSDNLRIWDQVSATDPDATKEYTGAGGFRGTSINSTYQIRKATDMFGPIGIGWGYNIIDDRIDEGHAIAGKDADGKPFLYENMVTKVHTLRIKLWFMLDGQRGEVEHYGHTPFVYTNKNGVQMESEACKKSLTDAIGKCLSMLGFSADIFMGEFDNRDYQEQIRTENQIKKAEDQEAKIIEKRTELTDYIQRHIESIKTAQTSNEITGIEKTSIRHLIRQAMISDLKQIAERGQRAISSEAEKARGLKNETV